jgi:ribosomal protein L37AE/L43A
VSGETRIKRLTDAEKATRRAEAYSCVLCHRRLTDDDDRSALHVYPDGCTAHRACLAEEGFPGTRHWHAMTELCEQCGEREPLGESDGLWKCGVCDGRRATPSPERGAAS